MSKDRQQFDPPSRILLEEYYTAKDSRFLPNLQRVESAKYLGTFVNRWLKDCQRSNNWARQQIKDYLLDEHNHPGHEVVVRRIFKHFQAENDHEMMGVLMVTFDRLVRRTIITRHHYNWQTRESWTTERILALSNKTHHDEYNRKHEYEWRGKKMSYPLPDRLNDSGNRLFSHRTRNYFRRAAWRHFRFLSYREPDVFVREICAALSHYCDADFQSGENIIDNWSLMHACYFHHEAVSFGPAHANIVSGHSLGQLTAKPYQPEAWKTNEAADSLIQLLLDAQSTLVRIWTLELLREHHMTRLDDLELTCVVRLMNSSDSLLQDFASQAFKNHKALPTITVTEWLTLIDEAEPSVLPTICEAMKQHVREDRLETAQLLELTCAKPHAVSELGFGLLQQRDMQHPLTGQELSQLADCECTSLSPHTTKWALEGIYSRGAYAVDFVIPFFDVLMRPTREAAMLWLQTEKSEAYDDPKLWVRLVESPFDDVKIKLVDLLAKRQQHDSLENGEMAPVWVSVILGIHRGSRSKPKAIQQIADEIEKNPSHAKGLLPVLGVALRSIRGPEMRYALSSLVRLTQHSPEIRNQIESLFPEMEIQEALP